MPERRPKIPKRIEKQVWQEAHGCCAYCRLDAIESLAVHHIRPWAAEPKHEFEHLILLCSSCHGRADAKVITQDQLHALKRTFESRRRVVGVPRAGDVEGKSVVQTSYGDSSINVAAESVTIRSVGRRSQSPLRISGTVSDDPFRIGYLQYLAHRFNAFKQWEVGRSRMKHAVIHVSYRRDFGFAIGTTPLSLFDTAASYLQRRVADTKLGRNLRAQGRAMFEAFDEFSPDRSDPAAGVG